MNDPTHYNDGLIDFRVIEEFSLIVFTNRDGETITLNYDDGRHTTLDEIKAYKGLWSKKWNMDDELEAYLQGFKNHLVSLLVPKEELEE